MAEYIAKDLKYYSTKKTCGAEPYHDYINRDELRKALNDLYFTGKLSLMQTIDSVPAAFRLNDKGEVVKHEKV